MSVLRTTGSAQAAPGCGSSTSISCVHRSEAVTATIRATRPLIIFRRATIWSHEIPR
ncbi:hypothetical protein PENSPDRAFT_659958 [Peniophora sp. CONT]|nr:hypothetical protein PENSPDRAFT_659958 [Peniophora sp. CONT]